MIKLNILISLFNLI